VPVGKFTIDTDKCDLHHARHYDNVQDKEHILFYAPAWKCAIREGNLQNNLLILLGTGKFTLVTRVHYFSAVDVKVFLLKQTIQITFVSS